MATEIIIDGENIIVPTDYAKKYEEIIKVLDDELFGDLTQENTTNVNVNTGIETKKRVKKNEIMPILSTTQVSALLHQRLRVYRPLSLKEIQMLTPDEVMVGFNYFMQLVTYVNNYISFVPDKQIVSAFLGMTTNSYDKLMQDPNYTDVFASIEDYLVSMNFVASQSGLVDTKTTLSKLQTQGNHGHNLIKSVDSITLVQNNYVDRKQVADKMARFKAMIEDKK